MIIIVLGLFFNAVSSAIKRYLTLTVYNAVDEQVNDICRHRANILLRLLTICRPVWRRNFGWQAEFLFLILLEFYCVILCNARSDRNQTAVLYQN